jgi:hypothetical protein
LFHFFFSSFIKKKEIERGPYQKWVVVVAVGVVVVVCKTNPLFDYSTTLDLGQGSAIKKTKGTLSLPTIRMKESKYQHVFIHQFFFFVVAVAN